MQPKGQQPATANINKEIFNCDLIIHPEWLGYLAKQGQPEDSHINGILYLRNRTVVINFKFETGDRGSISSTLLHEEKCDSEGTCFSKAEMKDYEKNSEVTVAKYK